VQPALLEDGSLFADGYHTAARLPDMRIVCVETNFAYQGLYTGQVLEPPPHGSPNDASWR